MKFNWLTWSLLILMGALAKAAPSIHVRELSILKVQQKSVQLADIAEVSGFSESDQKHLLNISIGDVPPDHEIREFTSFALSEILRAHLSPVERHYNEKVQLSIPRFVRVEVESATLTSGKVQRQIESHYQAQCAGCEVKVTNIQIAAPRNVTQWAVDFKNEIPRGPFSLPIRFTEMKGTEKIIWVTGKLSVYRVVPITNRNLAAGERIQPSDISNQKRDVTFGSDNVPEANELLGATVARTLAANQIIWKNALLKPRALSRGDVVRLVSGAEAWQVSINGVAQQAGYVGDVIQVLNPSTQKTLTGVVVEKGVVRIQ